MSPWNQNFLALRNCNEVHCSGTPKVSTHVEMGRSVCLQCLLTVFVYSACVVSVSTCMTTSLSLTRHNDRFARCISPTDERPFSLPQSSTVMSNLTGGRRSTFAVNTCSMGVETCKDYCCRVPTEGQTVIGVQGGRNTPHLRGS